MVIMKNIICFGDSNTYGYNPVTKGRFPDNIRWTGRLKCKVEKYNYSVIEEGLVGRTTVFEDSVRTGRKGSDFLIPLLESHFPVDTVILMLGTNDCKSIYNTTPHIIGKGIELLIKQIKDYNKDINILLISPIHLGEQVWKEEFDPEFCRQSVEVSKNLKWEYYRIARKYGCDFLAASDIVSPSKADQEHLDERGHRILAGEISKRFERKVS